MNALSAAMNSRRPSSVICAPHVISSVTLIISTNRNSRIAPICSVTRMLVLYCTTALALDISESVASCAAKFDREVQMPATAHMPLEYKIPTYRPFCAVGCYLRLSS